MQNRRSRKTPTPPVKLDFTIHTAQDRNAYISSQLPSPSTPTFHPTATQLETYANFILYGKDELTDKSAVDEKYIEIKPKYSSYARKRDKLASLDELRESPTFDERTVHPLKPNLYKNPKQKLDTSSPEFYTLKEEIARIEARLEKLESSTPSDPAEASLHATRIYHLKHLLISLRSQQYIIKDSLSPPRAYHPSRTPTESESLNLTVWPIGFYLGESSVRFHDPFNCSDLDSFTDYGLGLEPLPNPLLDYTNPTHIYQIAEHYESLLRTSLENPTSNEAYIVATFEFYANATPLADSRREILEMKRAGFANRDIRAHINGKFSTTYNENYISTIYVKEICSKIAATAKFHYLQWSHRGDPSAWKVCNECNINKLAESN